MEEGKSASKILIGKHAGKTLYLRHRDIRRRWEDNIRIDLKGMGVNTRNWADSAQDRSYWRALVNAALNLLVP